MTWTEIVDDKFVVVVGIVIVASLAMFAPPEAKDVANVALGALAGLAVGRQPKP